MKSKKQKIYNDFHIFRRMGSRLYNRKFIEIYLNNNRYEIEVYFNKNNIETSDATNESSLEIQIYNASASPADIDEHYIDDMTFEMAKKTMKVWEKEFLPWLKNYLKKIKDKLEEILEKDFIEKIYYSFMRERFIKKLFQGMREDKENDNNK